MIAVTGGGTGGHLSVADAVIKSLSARGIKPVFVGSVNGQDRGWFEKSDDLSECYFLESGGVVNKRGFGKLAALAKVLKSALFCISIIRRHKIKAVFSVGGYSAAPLVFAAVITRTPLFIHEQNAVIGSLNRIARPFAKEFFSSFIPSCGCPHYPVRKEFFDRARARVAVRTVIFLGGSQGSKAINDLALAAAPRLRSLGIGIVHQAGAKELQRVKAEYEHLGIEVELFDFDPRLVERIAAADFAVARAGAGTLFELAANGLPAFFIPYPYAAGDHQWYNALYLSSRGLSFVKRECDVGVDDLLQVLQSPIEGLSQKLMQLCDPAASECIAEKLLFYER